MTSSAASLVDLFEREPRLDGRVLLADTQVSPDFEEHTAASFSDKWNELKQGSDAADDEEWKQGQFAWYLKCYGYSSEDELASALRGGSVVVDAGCGPGYKAAWFARLSPATKVIGMDISDSVFAAADRYADYPNLTFIRGDIAATPFKDGSVDLISCDQVLHHTENPPHTVAEFFRMLAPGGILNTYVYAKKALPRELLDEHARSFSKQLSREELWQMSEQLTALGKLLSELEISIDVPDIPALGIRGGRQDLQRFIYWNFMKCFWNPEYGFEASRFINYDWYAPGTAFRYTREEFVSMLIGAGFEPEFLHSEEACHTGRFRK